MNRLVNWKYLILLLVVILAIPGVIFGMQAYPRVTKTDIALGNNRDVAPEDYIVVSFSQPVRTESYVQGIRIEPAAKFRLSWEDGNRKLAIIPQDFWQPGTSYSLHLPEGKNRFFIAVGAQNFSFSTVSFPKIIKISPVDGAENSVIDIEDPIVATFKESSKYFFIKFILDPAGDGTYVINRDRTEFRFMPKQPVKDGENYQVKILAKYIKDPSDNFKEIFSSNFKTAPPANIVWEKDYALRLEQARNYTKPKILTGKYIDVNLAAQIMATFQDGKLLDAYLISSGKRGMETPKGEHQIYNKTPRAWSKEYGLSMPYWNAILPDGKVGIHELPEWPGGYKEGASHLGIPVSHGCIRLGVGPAKIIYDWADIGTPVIVY